MTTPKTLEDSTENCYLTYTDELEGGGYLTCTYNHKAGESCLMDEKYCEVEQTYKSNE